MGESEQKSSGGLGTLSWLAIVALIGLLVWVIVIPNLRQARGGSSIACINNLRQIEAAKQQWALENGRTNGIVTWADIQTIHWPWSEGSLPKCPIGGTYSIGELGENPTCSLGQNESGSRFAAVGDLEIVSRSPPFVSPFIDSAISGCYRSRSRKWRRTTKTR